MDNSNLICGGCKCGRVRYEATGTPSSVAYCHCSDCRGYTGAPTMVWVAFVSDQVSFPKEKPKVFESSPGVEWGFCDICGTPLTWEANLSIFGGDNIKIMEFTISSLDRPEDFVPDQHWQDAERIPWFDVADDLPRYNRRRHGGAVPTHHGPKVSIR